MRIGVVPCKFLCVLVCSFLILSDATVHWAYCGAKKKYTILIDSVDMIPDPVVKGAPVTFNISAKAKNALLGGKIDIDVYYYGVRMQSETYDLCSKTHCPIQQGIFILSNTQALPGGEKIGFYKLRFKAVNEHGAELTCIYINFRVVNGNMASVI